MKRRLGLQDVCGHNGSTIIIFKNELKAWILFTLWAWLPYIWLFFFCCFPQKLNYTVSVSAQWKWFLLVWGGSIHLPSFILTFPKLHCKSLNWLLPWQRSHAAAALTNVKPYWVCHLAPKWMQCYLIHLNPPAEMNYWKEGNCILLNPLWWLHLSHD